MDVTNIRVDSTLLEANQGKVVRIIGRAESFDASSQTATLTSTGIINVKLPDNESLEVGKNYELVGKVSATNLTVNVYFVVALSDNLNLETAQKFVKYTHKVPELYYDA